MTKAATTLYSDIVPGVTVKVHQKIKDLTAKGEEKERVQIFEGLVIGRRGGSQAGATITVRKISNGVGVEKIFPLHMPSLVKIVPVKKAKVKRAKLYFTRTQKYKLKEIKTK